MLCKTEIGIELLWTWRDFVLKIALIELPGVFLGFVAILRRVIQNQGCCNSTPRRLYGRFHEHSCSCIFKHRLDLRQDCHLAELRFLALSKSESL